MTGNPRRLRAGVGAQAQTFGSKVPCPRRFKPYVPAPVDGQKFWRHQEFINKPPAPKLRFARACPSAIPRFPMRTLRAP